MALGGNHSAGTGRRSLTFPAVLAHPLTCRGTALSSPIAAFRRGGQTDEPTDVLETLITLETFNGQQHMIVPLCGPVTRRALQGIRLKTPMHEPRELCPIHSADATQLSSCVASALAVCIGHYIMRLPPLAAVDSAHPIRHTY